MHNPNYVNYKSAQKRKNGNPKNPGHHILCRKLFCIDKILKNKEKNY